MTNTCIYKKYLLTIGLFLMLVTNSYPQQTSLPSETIDKEFERLNIQWLENNATSKSSISINSTNFDYEYKVKDDIGSINIDGNCESGYYYLRFFNDSHFVLYKRYYPNGYIAEKGYRFNKLGAKNEKGKWYYFDKDRDLIKIWDFDKHFTYSFDDVINFCKKEGIQLRTGEAPRLESGFQPRISRSYSEILESAIWTIIYSKGGNQLEEITIDGKTGDVINRRPLEIIGA